ncbi:hypothetical protein IPJ70_00745 [Candidatus Campbellbacteria bacterium]|nr:MAG: hypothetical protein IPJ70_00745 [Candidatus Campbellbacteria bacterium]
MKKQPNGTGVAREIHLFNFKRGRQFGIFRNGNLMTLGSWWALRIRFDDKNSIVHCCFWRNCMELGDVRLTGEKLRCAVQEWVTFSEFIQDINTA